MPGDETEFTHTIDWRIVNFSVCPLEKGQKLQSLVSKAGNLFDTKWSVALYPKGKEDPDFIACFIKREDNVGPDTMHVEFEFSVLTFDGVMKYTKRESQEFQTDVSYGFNQFLELDTILRQKEFFLQSDTLTVRCKLRCLGPKKLPTSQNILTTRLRNEKSIFRMDIENFSDISKKNPQEIIIKTTDDVKDLLTLKVFMNKEESSEKTKACESKTPDPSESFLHIVIMKKEIKDPVFLSCWIKVLSKHKNIVVDKKMDHLFSEINAEEEWILPDFIDMKNLNDDCVEDDTLLLEFEFAFCDGKETSVHTSDLTPLKIKQEPKEATLMEDMVTMYETMEFPDVTLHIGDKAFPAHKFILIGRSLRFKQIFLRNDLQDSTDRKIDIEIEDVDKKTMERMLKFIYTDILEAIDDESSLLLYSAAQEYNIPSLSFRCLKLLKYNLSVKAVYKALTIAEEFTDSYLKMIALDVILNHYEYVMVTPEWQAFAEEHEGLSKQVIRHVRISKQQQSRN